MKNAYGFESVKQVEANRALFSLLRNGIKVNYVYYYQYNNITGNIVDTITIRIQENDGGADYWLHIRWGTENGVYIPFNKEDFWFMDLSDGDDMSTLEFNAKDFHFIIEGRDIKDKFKEKLKEEISE
jgi:hypothetical protein